MIGQEILHYKIIEKLGEGGMGAVYKAQDTKLERSVAIKFLPRHIAANSDERGRFNIEAKATAALNHPNIATIYAIEEVDDKIFIVMEFIPGKELKSHINASPLPLEESIDIAKQIAAGLRAAHNSDIIHRDIKSANIMSNEDGEVKIMDFGLAKVRGVAQVTKAGTTLGTTAYMSPEQTQGAPVDHRTDIWAFGVVLYEMLTGELPFRGEYEQAVMYSIMNEEPEPMADVAPGIEQIVVKALAKNPDERYQTAEEMLSDLKTVGDGQTGGQAAVARQPKLPWLIAAAMVVVLAIGFYIFIPSPNPAKAVMQTIAVLPFADRSPNKDQEYFSDGLAEELLNVLARNPGLRVTSRTSAFSFKDTNTDIRTIAEKLKVQYILEGSVRKSGSQLRIIAQLIDVESDAHLWSQIYDGTLDNIFAVQDTISRSVAEALQVTLLGAESASRQRETDPQAYNAYLLGKHFRELDTMEGLDKAAGYYQQALDIDPEYAPAWVGLSAVHYKQGDRGVLPRHEGYSKARQEVEKALELDPTLAEAHAQIGFIKRVHDWDWTGAKAAFKRALELEPGNVTATREAVSLARTLGQFKEGQALSQRAVELDPVSTSARSYAGAIAYYAGNLEEAKAAFRKALELNPQIPIAHHFIGRIYLEQGKPDSALAEMMREPRPLWRTLGLVFAYHAMGKQEKADAALATLVKEHQNHGTFQIAEAYAYQGENDKAFEWLERAYEQRDGGLASIKGDPKLRSLEKDPRYPAFMKKMNLPL